MRSSTSPISGSRSAGTKREGYHGAGGGDGHPRRAQTRRSSGEGVVCRRGERGTDQTAAGSDNGDAVSWSSRRDLRTVRRSMRFPMGNAPGAAPFVDGRRERRTEVEEGRTRAAKSTAVEHAGEGGRFLPRRTEVKVSRKGGDCGVGVSPGMVASSWAEGSWTSPTTDWGLKPTS